MTRRRFDRLLMATGAITRKKLPLYRLIARLSFDSYEAAIKDIAQEMGETMRQNGTSLPRELRNRKNMKNGWEDTDDLQILRGVSGNVHQS